MNTDSGDRIWQTAHEGVPKKWTQVGSGGNAIVWFDGVHAVKRMKPNIGREARARFQREAKIVSALQHEPGLSIVPLHEVREREGQTEIVMNLMDGSLDSAIELFSRNPEKSARALIPIAETLLSLSQREMPIYHRDIKPSNILFKDTEDMLYLADFGCAYVAEDERLTPPSRAMGAWAYRPPEYSVGRVDQVNEKGDIFSLGKLLWAMVNGQRGMVFPGAIWFDRAYDLGILYPNSPKIHHTMLLVSQAVAIRPELRPTLSQFIVGLRAISDSGNGQAGDGKVVEMLRVEALMEIEFQQRRASAATFVRAIYTDFHTALTVLHQENSEVQLWRQWLEAAQRTPQKMEALELQVAENESDAPVLNVRFRGFALNTRFHPAFDENPAYFDAWFGRERGHGASCSFRATNSQAGVTFESKLHSGQSESGPYTDTTLERFLRQSTDVLISTGDE